MDSYLRHLGPKEYSKVLREALDADYKTALAIGYGHTERLHFLLSDYELIERKLEDGLSSVSSFESEEVMEDVLRDISYAKAGKIANWITTDRSAFSNAQAYRTLVIQETIDDEYIVGRGFKDDLKEYVTPTTTLVLERDSTAAYGFYLKTAYANIEDDHAQATGHVHTKKELIEMNILDHKSLYQKSAFLLSGTRENTRYRAGENMNHEEELRISSFYKNKEYNVFLRGRKVSCYERNGNARNKITFEECPDNVKETIRAAMNTINNLKLSHNEFLALDKLEASVELLQTPLIDQEYKH